MTNDEIRPFTVNIAQSEITDLHRRLDATRWTSPEPVRDWSEGVPLTEAQRLARYWREEYDWRRFEQKLNRWPHFVTEIFGVDIHFIHARSPHPNALPLILTHGWPGSIAEFIDVIEPLTHPERHGGRVEDAYEVIVPSLPGYGFSGKPTEPDWNTTRVAEAWGVLMGRLGFPRWVAHGGDWGAAITHTLAKRPPKGLIAAHVSWPMVYPSNIDEEPSAEEQAAVDRFAAFQTEHSGYWYQQSTRPQTLGYGLADSPVGQMTWLYEKIVAWSDQSVDPRGGLTDDQILDNISLYWFTNSGGSSARMYKENPAPDFNIGPIDLPMAATVFPEENTYVAPRAWAEKSWSNIIHWNLAARGGHFPPFEQPEIFWKELWQAFRAVRPERTGE